MEEITRNDFSFFQNEILSDMKKMENKLNEKITKISKNFQNTALIIQQKYEIMKSKMDQITKTFEENTLIEDINNKLDKFNKKIEETTIINNTKIASFQKDLSNACYKYDKIFLNNISSPGLIGDGCPYQTMRAFLEFVNNTIKDIISSKDKSITNFKKYEDWVKESLDKFKEEIEVNKNEFYEFLNKEIKQYDKRSYEKMKVVEEKLSFIKIENGRYNYNFNKKSEELEEKLKIFYTMNDNLVNIYKICRKDYIQIKTKFNDLSEYFKEMKYTKKINYKSLFDDLSKKINMNKKQKTNADENKFINILPSIDDISKIKINKIDNNINSTQNFNFEIKQRDSPKFVKKKTFQIENFASNFNLKKNFYNAKNNPINNISNLNILSDNNNSTQEKRIKFPLKRQLTQNIEYSKPSTKISKIYNNNFIPEDKKESDSLILKESKSFNENINNILIYKIKEENKESNNNSINDIKDNENTDKEKKEDNQNDNNNEEKINDIEMNSSMSKSDVATYDQKVITNIEKKNEINDNSNNNNGKNNNILNNNINNTNSYNDSKIVTKINLDEELNKINKKFDDLYDKANNKIIDITYQINELISKINKIIFKREDNIKKINEIDFFVERKKNNIFLNNSGICLSYSNNRNFDQIKKDNNDKNNSFNNIYKFNRNKDIYKNKINFLNMSFNKKKLSDSRANSNDIINLMREKSICKSKNYYVRMIDTKSLNKIESYLIKKFTDPN